MIKRYLYISFFCLFSIILFACNKGSKVPARLPAQRAPSARMPNTSAPRVPSQATPNPNSALSQAKSAANQSSQAQSATSAANRASQVRSASPRHQSSSSTLNFDDSSYNSVLADNQDYGNDSQDNASSANLRTGARNSDRKGSSKFSNYTYSDDNDEFSSYFNYDDIPEKEAEVPVFNPGSLFFYNVVSDDKIPEKFKVVDALMRYDIDMDKRYTIKDILGLYMSDSDKQSKDDNKALMNLDDLKAQIAQEVRSDRTSQEKGVNIFWTGSERERQRDIIRLATDFYKIEITNDERTQSKVIKSLGMMTLDSYISTVNRIELADSEEKALAGLAEVHALPIDMSLSFYPYSFTYIKNDQDGTWSIPNFVTGGSFRAHYKFKNDKDFMLSAGLRIGIHQSFFPVIYNVPVMAEVGIGLGKFDIYAGLGLISSHINYGLARFAFEVEGFYNIFFGAHSSVFLGLNLLAGLKFGDPTAGFISFSKLFVSPVLGYKFAIDSVRNDKIFAVERDWYDIIILDPANATTAGNTKYNDKKYFVEVHHSGVPFDVNIFVSPYSVSALYNENSFSITAPYDIAMYAFNLGFSGHYKIISTQEMSIGAGIRADINQMFNKTLSTIPVLIDANIVMMNWNVEGHVGLGVSVTHQTYGVAALGVKIGGSYNLPLSLDSFLTFGLDIDLRLRLDNITSFGLSNLSHVQIDPFIGFKHSFDKYERLVFDASTGYATDECYIIDIINDDSDESGEETFDT